MGIKRDYPLLLPFALPDLMALRARCKAWLAEMFPPLSRACDEGYSAFFIAGARNPYLPGTVEHEDWQWGYEEANDDSIW